MKVAGWSALSNACRYGHDSVVSLLLAHPAIDVNSKDDYGETPFTIACATGRTSCAQLLLKDSRVQVNQPANSGYTPLWWVAANGRVDIARWWIASGREVDLGKPGKFSTDAIVAAEGWGRTGVVTLLLKFKKIPEETRYVVRLELGFCDEMAAMMFAMIVFVSDELLQINDSTTTPAARFFNLARRLPMELQMVLCYRMMKSAKEIISRTNCESAFKDLPGSLK